MFVFLISVVIRTVIARETGRPWEVARLKLVYFLISEKYYIKLFWKSEIRTILKKYSLLNKIKIFGSFYPDIYVKPVRMLYLIIIQISLFIILYYLDNLLRSIQRTLAKKYFRNVKYIIGIFFSDTLQDIFLKNFQNI